MATGGQGSGGDTKSEGSDSDDTSVEGLTRILGSCKWFNAAKGYGFITPDSEEGLRSDEDKQVQDIFVYQKAIKMPGFRSLKEGERVTCYYKKSDQGLEAVKVTDTQGNPCKGSDKRPKRKKRPDRCYNCGEAGHHAKECQFPPLPKRCHHCKSVDHLVADCPHKHEPTDAKSTSQPPTAQE